MAPTSLEANLSLAKTGNPPFALEAWKLRVQLRTGGGKVTEKEEPFLGPEPWKCRAMWAQRLGATVKVVTSEPFKVRSQTGCMQP